MPAFHEVRFPELISWGARGGPAYDTTVVEFATGKEQRNQNWSRGRMEWDIAHGVKVQEDLDELVAFFRARRGKAHGFRYKDWSSFKLVQEALQNTTDDTLVGDGATTVFNVVRTYELVSPPPASADINKEIRRLFKLRGGAGDPLTVLTEVFRVDGTPVSPASIDRNNGEITFTTPPGIGEVADVTIEYDVPVRFDVDRMSIELVDFNAFTWGAVSVKELNPLLEP